MNRPWNLMNRLGHPMNRLRGPRNRLGNQWGEALAESLLSLLLVVVAGVLLALASAVILRHSARTERAVTFVDASAASVYPAGTDGRFNAELGDVPMGSVTAREQGGLYYYEVG